MNILILGSGGREHALAWKIKQSPFINELYIAPGNAGTSHIGSNESLNINDIQEVKSFVLKHDIQFVIVGPEDPLAAGLCDAFRRDPELNDRHILGPDHAGAQLESSKDFAKRFMQKHGVPTAAYCTFTAELKAEALSYLQNHSLPIVMKADGLAAGKGVVICQSVSEAQKFLEEVWTEEKFGAAGSKVVVEQFLQGIELSVFALTDGKKYVMLPSAKDYKRVGEGDTGPNTGGMGTVSPPPFADQAFMQKVEERIVKPTIEGIRKDGFDYRGFVFFGLISVDGEPYVIEYNVRMGDPETQVVMPRITSDLLPLLVDTAKGELKENAMETDSRYAVAVIAVSEGYPDKYEKGFPISGLSLTTESLLFHAGTAEKDGQAVTSGGRVLAVVSMNEDLKTAAAETYKTLENIKFQGINYRKDIGQDLLKYLKANEVAS